MNIIIATQKTWNIINAQEFRDKFHNEHSIKIITENSELSFEEVDHFNPEFIFFPHWSFIIPAVIYENYTCVVFHMTDLPFGRGGSPLQNLIAKGIYKTKISAIKVDKGLDTGDVYLKENFDLSQGSASDLYGRASDIIFNKMIPEIIEKKLTPVKQAGEVVNFKRRTQQDSCIEQDFSEKKIYDYIRMLDAEGYPPAYINYGPYRLTFTDAKMDNGTVMASAKFIRRPESDG